MLSLIKVNSHSIRVVMMTPLQRAKKSAEIMWKKDNASKGIGIKIERISPGEADLSLLVESKHLNGHDICHGI